MTMGLQKVHCFIILWTICLLVLLMTVIWTQLTVNVYWTNPRISCQQLTEIVTRNNSLILKQGSISRPVSLDQHPDFRERFRMWDQSHQMLTLAPGPDRTSTSEKYLIYRCDEDKMKWCGGWADRINGVLLAYILANITGVCRCPYTAKASLIVKIASSSTTSGKGEGRVFKVEMLTPPCDMLSYVRPNRVPWSLPQSFHKDLAHDPGDFQIINMAGNRTFYKNVHKTNFTSLVLNETVKYVYFQSNLDHIDGIKRNSLYSHQLSWMIRARSDQVYSALYQRLFKLSPNLQTRMADFLKRVLPTSRHRLICAQIRMGKNPTIPMDKTERLKPSHLISTMNFLANQSRYSTDRIFVMTDSECVASLLRNHSFSHRLVESGGPILHIERHKDMRSPKDMCDGWGKVIFDQHVLMQCDVLLVSWSGIGRMAARIRGSEHGLYCLQRAGRIVPCKTEGLYEILQGKGNLSQTE